MASQDPSGGREPPGGKPKRLVSDYFKPASQSKDTSKDKEYEPKSPSSDEIEDIDLSSQKVRRLCLWSVSLY